MPSFRVLEAFSLENLIGKPRAAFERDARGPFPPRPQRAPLHARGGEMTQMSLIRGSGEGRGGRRRLPGLVNGRITKICAHTPRPRGVRGPAYREIGTFASKVARLRVGEPVRRRGPPSPHAYAGAPRPHGGARRCAVAPAAELLILHDGEKRKRYLHGVPIEFSIYASKYG